MDENDYTTTISVRMPVSMVKTLDESVKLYGYADRSDAIRSLITYGNHFVISAKAIRDNPTPDGMEKLIDELDIKRRNETYAQWFKNLDKTVQSAIIEISMLVRDGKWIQTELTRYENH